jgi:DNA primase large subunit
MPDKLPSAEELAVSIHDKFYFGHEQEAAQLIESAFAAIRADEAEKRCDNCDKDKAINAFRMDELDAVMMSVDKWLDGTALRNNPATRAADAREIALKAIEATEAKLRIQSERYAACVEDIKARIKLDKDTFSACGRSTVGHFRSLMLIDEALAELEGKGKI